jgi:hypothetical protein
LTSHRCDNITKVPQSPGSSSDCHLAQGAVL